MTHRCKECSRLNPDGATFCYYDGTPLNGGGGGRSIDFSTWTFPRPFIFSDGETCRNYLEFAQACHRNPKASIEILKQGYLESFFASLGRVDLAMMAQGAARSPDPERGLDDLLGKLPGSPLLAAKLQVEPTEKNLGILQVGEDRHFDLTLTNKGHRLVYGQAVVDNCPWLVLGDNGTPDKIIQFSEQAVLAVHVRGKHLRAYEKVQKAQITVETNGGNFTITVQVRVPVKPFPEGVLAGAMTPRQMAEKAKANTSAAAVLIENGVVARWYEANGWTYPVQGPTASGLAAVQQLFEMLGLVKTPNVELSESAITMRGNPGDRLDYTLTVTALEKRAAVAHGHSDQPWLTVGKPIFRGQNAAIPLTVSEVPDEPGKALTAQLKVTANGNKRFEVPVTLTVGPRPAGYVPPRPPTQATDIAGSPPLDVRTPLSASSSVVSLAPSLLHSGPSLPPPSTSPNPPVSEMAPLEPVVAELASDPPASPPVKAPATVSAEPAPVAAAPPSDTRRRFSWPRLLPIGIVVAGLLTALVRDMVFYEPPEEPLPEVDYANPRLAIHFHDRVLPGDFVPTPSMRFGLGIPDEADPKKYKTKLVYDDFGRTCNVCVLIDRTVNYLWGIEQGVWKGQPLEPLGLDQKGNKLIGAKSSWVRSGPPKVTVTQYVEIVPGGLSADGKKRLLDTCLVRYDLTNDDGIAHDVGLRFMLDTFIGSNDAVPFTIAGSKELCSTMMQFSQADAVPDFISALERQDLKNPGTVAHLSLKYGGGLEPPTRVTLGAWPAAELRRHPGGEKAEMMNTRWEVPVLPMALAKSAENPAGDSAVTLYWDEKPIPPKQSRVIAFAYGLGSITGEKGEGQLALTAGGEVVEGKEFTLTAYVKNPAPGTTITLGLPRGLQLTSGNEKEAVPMVPAGASSPNSPVSWRVKASKSGIIPVHVSLSSGATLTHKLVVRTAAKIY